MSAKMKSFPALLVISLCANAIMLGIIGGNWLSEGRHHTRGERPQSEESSREGSFEERLARNALRALPDDDRESTQRAFSERWRQSYEIRAHLTEVRENVAELLSQETVDAEALDAAFDDIRHSEFALREQFYASLTDLMVTIPRERRQNLVEQSLRRHERRDQHREEFHEARQERRIGPDNVPPPPPPGGFGHDQTPPPPPPQD